MNQIAKVAPEIRAVIPTSVPEALRALADMKRDIDSDKTYAAIRRIERIAEAMKILYAEVEDVRREAEAVVVLANHRIALESKKVPPATGARGQLAGRDSSGATRKVAPEDSKSPTLKEQFGSQGRGVRIRKLADIPEPIIKETIAKIQASGKEATVNSVIKSVAGDKTKETREKSRAAAPIADGMDLRIGDCRIVLADIADNSIPLILTDPPYGDEAEPLYRWMAQWASRVLIPGGSMICYTGQSRLNCDIAIFDERLRYWWLLIMQHDQSQRLAGKFVIANFKPVLWYVKEHRRGRTLVPDVLKSVARDKSQHAWSQGEGGISPLIEHLTSPGETIVDPFAGTANWGRAAVQMGRRWIGADIAKGGSEKVAAG